MSQHRYPCTAEPPPPILGGEGSHQHTCIHDAPEQPIHHPIEHQCVCGTTWVMASYWQPRPAPDVSWVTTEPEVKPLKHPKRWGFGLLIALLALCMIAGALIAEAVN